MVRSPRLNLVRRPSVLWDCDFAGAANGHRGSVASPLSGKNQRRTEVGMKAHGKFNWRVVVPIGAGSLLLLDAALIARNDAFGSFLLAVGGVVLVLFGFWNWSK